MRTFKNAHVVVTGAASGIGEATSLELARRGANLSLLDIDAVGAERVAGKIREFGREVRVFPVDMGDAAAVAEVAGAVLAERPSIDLLVNNAGVAVVAPFVDTSSTDFEWLMNINVWGPLRLTRALLPSMIERGTGHIAIVASLAGLVGAPGMVAYSTSKFALVGFAESLRLELADTGIGVTTMCPGYVRTNLSNATRYGNERFKNFLDNAPSVYGMTKEHVATALVDAIRDRRPLVVMGPEKIGWWLKRFVPGAGFAISRWVARRTVAA